MSPDWISLPSVIYRKIGDYCKAKDVLAWASTCRTVQSQLNISVLQPSYELIYSQHYSASPIQQALSIPIFSPKHCHSVCITCQWIDPGTPEESARIYIVARPKSGNQEEHAVAIPGGTPPTTQHLGDQESPSSPNNSTSTNANTTTTTPTTSTQRWIQDAEGNRASIVWETQTRPSWINIHELVMDVTWNHDPTQDYFLWYSCPIYLLIEHFQIQALLVWEDDPMTRYRQATYSRCMALEAIEQEELFSARVEPNDAFGGSPDYQAQVHTMVADLFTATIDSLSKTLPSFNPPLITPTAATSTTTTPQPALRTTTSSTPIHAIFQSIASSQGMENLHQLSKPLQLVASIYEQLVEQKEPQYCSIFPSQSHHHNNNNDTHHRRRRLAVLPWIPIKAEFGWFPQEDLKEIPRFVARIPLAPRTQRLHLQAQRRGTQHSYRAHGSCTFFLLGQVTMNNHTETTTTTTTCSTTTLLSPDTHDASSSSSPSTTTATTTTTNSTTSTTIDSDGTNLWKMGDSVYCRRHLFIVSETATELDITISLVDQQDVQAYYLYVVPDRSTMEEFSGLQVQLDVLELLSSHKDDHNHDDDHHSNNDDYDNMTHNVEEKEEDVDDTVDYSLSRVMEVFLDPLRAHHESSMLPSPLEQGISFPMQLLKAIAMTLLLDDGNRSDTTTGIDNSSDPNLALVSFLKNHGLSTTPSGLACIVELIDAIAQQKKSSFGHDMNADNLQPEHHDDPMIRTFRAM